MGCAESLFFATTPWMKRAIWSAPPPVPAGTTNSIGLDGTQAAWERAVVEQPSPKANKAATKCALKAERKNIEFT
jgi:hypothetical protein